MNQLSFLFLILVAFLPVIVDYCSTSDNITNVRRLYVIPVANASCPYPGDVCQTISHYANNSETYFNTDSELIFLQGEHNLNENLTLQGGDSFTMLTMLTLDSEREPQQSRIHFGESVLFAISGLHKLTIESLEFLENSNFIIEGSGTVHFMNVRLSGIGYSFKAIDQLTVLNLIVSNASESLVTSAVLVIQECSAELMNVSVLKNSGKSIVLVDQSSIKFTDIVCTNNTAVESSSLMITNSNASFEGKNQFYMNTCENDGGALSVANSTVIFSHQTEMIDNTAQGSQGGAVNLSYSSVTFSGLLIARNNSINIQHYSHAQFGGFMNSFWSNITINGTAVFEDNNIDSYTLCIGGAISSRMSTLVLSGSAKFRNNYLTCLQSCGGAITLVNSILAAVDIQFIFSNNMASMGGAIALIGVEVTYDDKFVNNTLHISGASLLEANQATNMGGAVYGSGKFNATFIGNTSLVSGKAEQWGSHITFQSCVESYASFNGRTELKHTYVTNELVSISEDVRVTFSGRTIVENNTVLDGIGVLRTTSNRALYNFIGQTIFRGNKGTVMVLNQHLSPEQPILFGEAVFLENDVGISLQSSKAYIKGDFKFMHNSGPCIVVSKSSNVTFNGTMKVEANSADRGPAINSYSSTVYMYSDSVFYNNSARYDGGSVFLTDSDFYLAADHKFISNKAKSGGAVYAINSNVHLSGNLIFTQNHAELGGVFALGVYTVIHFDDLYTNLTQNVAKRGGIIYVEDVFNSIDCSNDSDMPVPKATSVRSKCFYSIVKDSDVSVVHRDNIATNKGNILFGGNLKRCDNKYASYDFQHLFGLQTAVHIQSISSNPYQIVLCDSSTITVSTLPGKLFSISVVGLDQLSQPISSIIRALLPVQLNYTSRLGNFQSKQTANGSCTSLNYRVYTQAPSLQLTLYPEGPCNNVGNASVSVTVHLGKCPDGFQLAIDECTCASDVLKYTSVCNVDNESILNNGDFWAKGLYDNGSYKGMMSFPHCPFDYCRQTLVYFTFIDPDLQCARNRSGIMCGQCSVNHSLTFGGGGCTVCPPSPAITCALLLLFAGSGVALVAMLILLRLTVMYGTLNGLIFYANIVGSNEDIFKIRGWASIFISWLNLDFGFSVCFYDGMDIYAHTWMQFLFPFYIWILIGIIIFTSHYSAWMTRRLGSNPIAVLATLILLSYAKLLRTIITVFYSADLELPHGQTTQVWLYDGNIPYLRDKHLPLFIFAWVFFMFVFIPYSLLLLLGPCLQKIPSEKYDEPRYKAWIRGVLVGWYKDYRIQSFMAAYTAPYNSGYHYWTGFFLMLRCVLFLVFTSNSLGDSSINLLAILTVTLATTIFTRLLKGRVYKSWWVDLLEALFLLNLGVLSAGTFYTTSTGGNQLILAQISVGVSLTLLVIILMFHLWKQVMSTSVYKFIDQKLRKLSVIRKFSQDLNNETDTEQLSPLIGDSTAASVSEEELKPSAVAPTTTYITLS